MGERRDSVENLKFEVLDEKIGLHENRLNNHSQRLDAIERETSRFDVRLESLLKQLESLTTTMRWFMGLLVGALVSFFFYCFQHVIFKG
jgi:chromosome segregation ATPase